MAGLTGPRPAPEVPLYANDAYVAYYHRPARARLRGLALNPAVPGELLRRLVDAYPDEVTLYLNARTVWTDEQFDALVDHTEPRVRVQLAEALQVRPEQRARLVDDPDPEVIAMLADGPPDFGLPLLPLQPLLPRWAYERLIERDAGLARSIARNHWAPADLRSGLPTAARLSPAELAEAADDAEEWTRAGAAADPALPADVVARLATDPSPLVRLAVSMRPEFTEEQRAAIDYEVAPYDYITPAPWATTTRDPDEQRRCAYSGHIGLRRSVAVNPALAPDLVAVLAHDDDFAVRLLLCENQAAVPGETVLATFLEATTITRGRLLEHPALQRTGLARLAGSDNPGARALVVLDPEAPPELIDRISRDPHPAVRRSAASDERLPVERVLELFADPLTTEAAAANPRLPAAAMEEVIAGGADLAHEQPEEERRLYLGNWG